MLLISGISNFVSLQPENITRLVTKAKRKTLIFMILYQKAVWSLNKCCLKLFQIAELTSSYNQVVMENKQMEHHHHHRAGSRARDVRSINTPAAAAPAAPAPVQQIIVTGGNDMQTTNRLALCSLRLMGFWIKMSNRFETWPFSITRWGEEKVR